MPNNVAGLQLQSVPQRLHGHARNLSQGGNSWQCQPETPSRRLIFGLGIGWNEDVAGPLPSPAASDKTGFSGLDLPPLFAESCQPCEVPAPRRPSWEAFATGFSAPTTPPHSPVLYSPYNDLAEPWPTAAFAGVARQGLGPVPDSPCVSPQLLSAPERWAWLPRFGQWRWSVPWPDGAISYQPLLAPADLAAAAEEINALHSASRAVVVRGCVLEVAFPAFLQAHLQQRGFCPLPLEGGQPSASADFQEGAAPPAQRATTPTRYLTPEPNELRQAVTFAVQLPTPQSLSSTSPRQPAIRGHEDHPYRPPAPRKRVRLALEPSFAPTPPQAWSPELQSPTAGERHGCPPTPQFEAKSSWAQREPLLRVTWYAGAPDEICAYLPPEGAGRDAVRRAALEAWCIEGVETWQDRGTDGRPVLHLVGLGPINRWLAEVGLRAIKPRGA